jgi:Ca2+-binding RTX toxin-like protein
MPPFAPPRNIGLIRGYVTVGDFNNDGLVEPLYFINNGDGTFDNSPWDSIQAILEPYSGRINRASAIFDVDGDGNLDVVWNVYSDPGQEDSFTLVLYGNGDGTFTRFEEYPEVNGFGETLVVADFNNDGLSDVFAPVYTHVPGSDICYLLFNEGGRLGDNRAEEWGVSLSGMPVFFRVEGAQAADVDFDGRIDLYVGSHLFMNQGDHFSAYALDPFLFDEGAAFLDFDNDGDFDLALRDDEGSPRLLRNDGGTFTDLGAMLDDVTGGDGLKVYDIDGNGWEDLVFGSPLGLTIMFNQDGAFERTDLPDVPYSATLAFFDADNDGRIDLVGQPNGPPSGVQAFFLENDLPRGETITLTLLGAGGELNQHGRSVRLTSLEDPTIRMARAVESGSGLLTQSQYTMLIGLPVSGLFNVEVAFASGIYAFLAAKDLNVVAFADGRVAMTGGTGDDAMMGGIGADRLDGGDGNDRLYGSQGADDIEGGAGQDILDFSRVAIAVSVNLADGVATLGLDVQAVAGIEDVAGSELDDGILGDASSNLLFGGGGDDLLDGGGGTDALSGGAGDDVFILDDSGDSVAELAGAGNDEVRTALAAYVLPDNVESLTGLSALAQELTGNALGNLISGGAGADTFRGLAGDDIYLVGVGDTVAEAAGEGVDEVRTLLASYTLGENLENLLGTGAAGQELIGNGLANRIEGGAGPDSLEGGGGDDVYVADAGDQVVEIGGEGLDEVRTSLATYALPANVEILVGTSLLGQDLTGNDLGNRISGGAGADVFRGGGGDDLYLAGTGDQVVEQAGGGIDEIATALTIYSLGENIENLTGTALRAQKLIGNILDNVIRSGIGADTLIGAGGDDIYYVNSGLDYIYELSGDGFDIVRTTGTYLLYHNAHIERLEIADAAGAAAISLYGNEFGNHIVGNAGANVLVGGGGADVLQGLGGDDIYGIDAVGTVVIEVDGEGFDQVATFVDYTLTDAMSIEVLYARDNTLTTSLVLTGNALANALYGNAGSNTLIGGGGADILTGYAGNDFYRVEEAGDAVVEYAGGGFDSVYAVGSYTLAAGTEIELLSAIDPAAAAAMTLIGNEFANIIYGNAGSNTLIGGGAADILIGDAGNDFYRVEEAGDVVVESAGGGYDSVYAVGSYTLGAGSEVELLSAIDPASAAAMTLTGNAFVNTIIGTAGVNTLIGGGGADVLIGGAGNDFYRAEEAGDVIVESAGGGFDSVYAATGYSLGAGSEIELLSAIDPASAAAMDLIGNEFANRLYGNAGVNVLDGKSGSDLLTGSGGADFFAFTTALGAGNVDAIADFAAGTDKIRLDDSVFTALVPGALGANAFVVGSAAADASDRIVYNQATGQLFYDADGSGAGAAFLFATLGPGVSLGAGDFQII